MLGATLPLAMLIALGQVDKIELGPPNSKEQIRYEYDSPFDYGVMVGNPVPADLLVDRRHGQPTYFKADPQRLVWSHQNMARLQRSRIICRGDGDVLPLRAAPISFDELLIDDQSGKPMAFEDWVDCQVPDAMLIVYCSEGHGPIVALERYWHGMKSDTPHFLWSASKSLSAGVVAHALASHRLDFDTVVTRFVPELAGGGLQGATIQDVLNMGSGTRVTDDPPEKNWFVEWGRATHFFEPLPGEEYPDGQIAFYAANVQSNGINHGQFFHYKDIDPWSAVMASCRALEGDFPDLFSSLIWSRIGAAHEATVCVDQHGNCMTTLGISTTLRDLTRWGIAHLAQRSDGAIPGDFVERLSKLNRIQVPKDSPQLNDPQFALIHNNGGYSNLYWQYANPTIAFAAAGWHGQRCSIHPEERVIITQFKSLPSKGTGAYTAPAYAAIAQYVAERYRRAGF